MEGFTYEVGVGEGTSARAVLSVLSVVPRLCRRAGFGPPASTSTLPSHSPPTTAGLTLTIHNFIGVLQSHHFSLLRLLGHQILYAMTSDQGPYLHPIQHDRRRGTRPRRAYRRRPGSVEPLRAVSGYDPTNLGYGIQTVKMTLRRKNLNTDTSKWLKGPARASKSSECCSCGREAATQVGQKAKPNLPAKTSMSKYGRQPTRSESDSDSIWQLLCDSNSNSNSSSTKPPVARRYSATCSSCLSRCYFACSR